MAALQYTSNTYFIEPTRSLRTFQLNEAETKSRGGREKLLTARLACISSYNAANFKALLRFHEAAIA